MIESTTLLSKTYLDNDINIIDKYTYYDDKYIIKLLSEDEASIEHNKTSKYAYHLIDRIPCISISNKELEILRNLNVKKLNFELLDIQGYDKEPLDFNDFNIHANYVTIENKDAQFFNFNGTINNLRLIYRNSFSSLREPLEKMENVVKGFSNINCDNLVITKNIYNAIIKGNTILFDKFKPKILRTGSLPKRHQLFSTKFRTDNYHRFFINHPELECDIVYFDWWTDKYIYKITRNPSTTNENVDSRGFYLERIKSEEQHQIKPFYCC